MKALVALALAAVGCSSTRNPCDGVPGLCVAVEVTGNAPALDELDLSMLVPPSRKLSGRALGRNPVEIQLPVQFAALLPSDVSGAVLLEVVGARSGVALAFGSAALTVPPSGQRVTVHLGPLVGDGGAPVDLAQFHIGADLAGTSADLLGVDLAGADLSLVGDGCASVGCGTRTCGTISDGCGNTITCGPACVLGTFTTFGSGFTPARAAFAMAQSGSHYYAVGGQEAASGSSVVQMATANPDGTMSALSGQPSLSSARFAPSAIAIGNFLYVIGGALPSALPGILPPSVTTTIERAPINADGSLGAFAAVTAALGTPREAHMSVVVGSYLYVLGGDNGPGALNTIERAPINGDGSLGTFAAAGALTTGRDAASAVLTASFLYVIGGNDGTSQVRSVERAAVNPDGTLGPFADAGITLPEARDSMTATLVGDHLYIVGGGYCSGDAGTPTYPTTTADSLVVAGTLIGFNSVAGSNLMVGRAGHGAIPTATALYVFGGSDGVNPLSSIERAPLQ
jgi:hypothetical protein